MLFYVQMLRIWAITFIYIGLFLPHVGQALTCHSYLQPNFSSIAEQVTNHRLKLETQRKALEEKIFKSYGNIPPTLEKSLYLIFHNPKRRDLKAQALKALKHSSLTSKMHLSTHIKILYLLQRQVVRPYMAVLIGRYIEQVEFKNEILSPSALQATTQVVASFITERALIETQKLMRSNSSRELQLEVQDFLNAKVSYQPHTLNYKKPRGHLVLSNAVLGFIFTFEDIIAHQPIIINLNGHPTFF